MKLSQKTMWKLTRQTLTLGSSDTAKVMDFDTRNEAVCIRIITTVLMNVHLQHQNKNRFHAKYAEKCHRRHNTKLRMLSRKISSDEITSVKNDIQ